MNSNVDDDDFFFYLFISASHILVQFILANNKSIKFGAIDPRAYTSQHQFTRTQAQRDREILCECVDFHFHLKSRDLLGRAIKTSKQLVLLLLLILLCQKNEKKIHCVMSLSSNHRIAFTLMRNKNIVCCCIEKWNSIINSDVIFNNIRCVFFFNSFSFAQRDLR